MRRHIWSMLLFAPLVLSASSWAGEKQAAEEEPVYQGKTLKEWIGDLKDPKKEIHRAAAKSLVVFGPKKQIVSALTAALKESEDVGLVVETARALGKFGPAAKESLPALRAAFKERKNLYSKMNRPELLDLVSLAITEALVLIDDHPGPELAPILVEALKTDDGDKRRDIVAKLGKLGPDAAKTTVPALIAILADTENAVSQASGIAYSDSKSIPREKLLAIRLEAIKSLGRIGPAAKPALHALTLALKMAAPEKGTPVRQMEVSDKPAGSSGASIRPIAFTSVSGNSAMLRACAEALGRIRPGAKGTGAAMGIMLRDLDAEVRWAALCALLESGQDTKEAVPTLRNLLKDKDVALRKTAVEALGQSKGEVKEILPSLTAALKDEDATVREAAVKQLGKKSAAAKQVVPALLVALTDETANVRRGVAEALGKIGVADEAVIAALIAALKDKEESVRGEAGMALAQFGPKAKAAIPPLLDFAQSTNAKQRAAACILLGFFGPVAKEAIPVLEKQAREDSEEWVRLAAYTGLAKIDSSRVKDTVRRLTMALKNKSEEIRGAAIECLAYLGPDARDALPALRALRENSNDLSQNISIRDAVEEIEKPKK